MLRHRRQTTRQILIPFVLANLLILATAILVGVSAFRPGADAGRWAAIATIWLVIPLMLGMLVLLALLAGMVYGLARLLKITPEYTGKAQSWLLWLNLKIRETADKIIQPVLSLKAWLGIFSRND